MKNKRVSLKSYDFWDILLSLYDLVKHVPVPIEPEVFVKTWIFTHGIATIVSTNRADITPEEIRQLLIEACASFKLYHNENESEKKYEIG